MHGRCGALGKPIKMEGMLWKGNICWANFQSICFNLANIAYMWKEKKFSYVTYSAQCSSTFALKEGLWNCPYSDAGSQVGKREKVSAIPCTSLFSPFQPLYSIEQRWIFKRHVSCMSAVWGKTHGVIVWQCDKQMGRVMLGDGLGGTGQCKAWWLGQIVRERAMSGFEVGGILSGSRWESGRWIWMGKGHNQTLSKEASLCLLHVICFLGGRKATWKARERNDTVARTE